MYSESNPLIVTWFIGLSSYGALIGYQGYGITGSIICAGIFGIMGYSTGKRMHNDFYDSKND